MYNYFKKIDYTESEVSNMTTTQKLTDVRIYHLEGNDVFELHNKIIRTPEYTALFDYIGNDDATHLNEENPLQRIMDFVDEPEILQIKYKDTLLGFIQFAQQFWHSFQVNPNVTRKISNLIFKDNPEVNDKIRISFDQRIDEIDGKFIKVYTPKTCEEMIYYFCARLLTETPLIQQCKLCGNFFIPEPRNVEYCDRFYKDTGRRCNEIGAQVIFKERRQKDEIGRLYDVLYRRFVGRVQRGTIPRSTFDIWAKKAKEAKRQAKQGDITFETYKSILEDFNNQ